MGEMTRQQLCAELGVSESTIRRLEQAGLPFTPIGLRMKRYNLAECKAWLRDAYEPGKRLEARGIDYTLAAATDQFVLTARKVKRRVEPS